MRSDQYMKTLFFTVFSCFLAVSLFSQHYYKDLVLTGELAKKRALYQSTRVRSVRINSFDNMDQPIEKFNCNQSVANNFTEIKTITTDPLTGTSESSSFFDQKGQLVKTIDTSDGNKNIVTYGYNPSGKLSVVTSQSSSPGQFNSREQHFWEYDANGKPQRMVKIKNETDTTHIEFVLDDKGNVIEEKSRIRGVLQPGIYYYYDLENRLTDIVRYNMRAKRMLPDYIFEYNEQGQLRTMLTPMQNMGDYQKWYYTYDEKGLKQKDECFSKTRVLIGRMEYQYQF
jgi:antitoxin component YwqK of YwqJK toxin-antitoxin module